MKSNPTAEAIEAFKVQWSRDRRTDPKADDDVNMTVWMRGTEQPHYFDLRGLMDGQKRGDGFQVVIAAIQTALIQHAHDEQPEPELEPAQGPLKDISSIDWKMIGLLFQDMRNYPEIPRRRLLHLILDIVAEPWFEDLAGMVHALAARQAEAGES